MDYYSDKERGTKPRTTESITPAVWGGIVALIKELISSGAFGNRYPERCPDGAGTVGTDENMFSLAVKAEISDIDWPLKTEQQKTDGPSWETEPYVPDTVTVLDLIQFCYQSVAKPIPQSYHSFFGHSHLKGGGLWGRCFLALFPGENYYIDRKVDGQVILSHATTCTFRHSGSASSHYDKGYR